MLKKELKYLTIEYSNKDLNYIKSLSNDIDKMAEEIVDFFILDKFGEKVEVKLWSDLNDFREYYKRMNYCDNSDLEVPDWICGFAKDNNVDTLCLEEYVKTRSHENADVDDLKYLILHEFTHACHAKIGDATCTAWLSEGFATALSHQFDNIEKKFDATLSEMINGCSRYYNYYTMFLYVLEIYGKDFAINLAKNSKLQERLTSKLYQETCDYYKI